MVEISFGSKKPEQVPGQQVQQMPDLASEIRDLSSRIRSIEETMTNIRHKIQITDSNLLSRSKQLDTEIKASNMDVRDLRRELIELRDHVSLILKELKLRATTDELKVLQRYVDLWNPINFVTKKDVENIVEEKLRSMGNGKV